MAPSIVKKSLALFHASRKQTTQLGCGALARSFGQRTTDQFHKKNRPGRNSTRSVGKNTCRSVFPGNYRPHCNYPQCNYIVGAAGAGAGAAFLAARFLVLLFLAGAAFFLVDFLAAFFLAGAAFFLVDFLAAFFLAGAAFFFVDFLTAFFAAFFFVAIALWAPSVIAPWFNTGSPSGRTERKGGTHLKLNRTARPRSKARVAVPLTPKKI